MSSVIVALMVIDVFLKILESFTVFKKFGVGFGPSCKLYQSVNVIMCKCNAVCIRELKWISIYFHVINLSIIGSILTSPTCCHISLLPVHIVYIPMHYFLSVQKISQMNAGLFCQRFSCVRFNRTDLIFLSVSLDLLWVAPCLLHYSDIIQSYVQHSHSYCGIALSILSIPITSSL